MEPRRLIRSGIAASAIGHLSILAMVLLFAEVHPLGSMTAEPITVDLVSPDEAVQAPQKAEPTPEPKAQPSDAFDLSSKSGATQPPSSAPQPAAPQPQQQAPPWTPPPERQQIAAEPPPSASASPSPAYTPPEPDITLKYHVMLGLPPELPPSLPQDKPGDGFDAPASQAADVASSLVTEFRRHLKTCSKLPGSIASTDKVKIVLRVLMARDGKLASAPMLIEASASAKGPLLMQSAMSALQACQPYAMLPVDRYAEWKALDLSFTPQDFSGG